MLLKLQDICKDYQQGREVTHVLKGINLELEKGEYVAIMGPSGSGKSTLMNIIGCLDRPTSGSYFLDGKDVFASSDRELSSIRLDSIGFIFQSYFLMPRETALSNVCLPLLYAGVPKKKRQEIARKALETVGLGDRVSHRPGQLSGGQCQRVAIARAIANSPKLILADEPTGALDSKSGKEVMALFDRLHGEGATILMITHDSTVAARAERTIHIFDGEIRTETPEIPENADDALGGSGKVKSGEPSSDGTAEVSAPE